MFESDWNLTVPDFWRRKKIGNSMSFFSHVNTTVPYSHHTQNNLQYAVKAQTSLTPLSWFHGSRVTTAHAHQCCRFQSYAKTVPSRMKLTMREPTFMGSMTTDHVITACDFNSVDSKWALTVYTHYSSLHNLHQHSAGKTAPYLGFTLIASGLLYGVAALFF